MPKSKFGSSILSPIFVLPSAKNQADRQAEVREIKRRLTRKVKQHAGKHPSVKPCIYLILN